jgi:DNA-binding CsgD family transcriptional regulator
VRSLPERDAAALLSAISELTALDEAEPFPPAFLGRLASLVTSDCVFYSELDREHEHALYQAIWAEGCAWFGVPENSEDWDYWRLRHQHPVCGFRERTNDWTTTRMESDFVTQRQFHRTEIWQEIYRHEQTNHWLDVGLEPTGKNTRKLVFTRERHGFDERDRLVLELLQPHLQRRYDDVQAMSEAVDVLAALEERGDDNPRHVVLCSSHGVIEFASPKSRRLLETYFGPINGRLPEPVIRWLPSTSQLVSVERDGRRLSVRSARVGPLIVLLIAERDVRLDRLTARQREILHHVARGETNDEIAFALSISAATVGKHLEKLYTRLGVNTRTAAAAALLAPGSAE